MAKIPLNLFKRVTATVTTSQNPIYEAPIERAGIIITALASNLTPNKQTITVSLSSNGNDASFYDIVKNYELPPNDTTNIVVNKLVLFQGDVFIVSGGADDYLGSPAVNITLSILESVNIP